MNGQPHIDTVEATEHLKNILNVGKTDEPTAVPVKSKFSCKMEQSNSNTDFGNENVFQKVDLSGEDLNLPIYGTNVVVYSSLLQSNPSLKIMIDNVVDYGWEPKYYIGRLISIHQSMKYLAYSLKSPVNPSGGFVRVIKQESSKNLLLRGFKGAVRDLSFAYSLTKIMLGCVDEVGQLFVYEIIDNGSELLSQLCIHVIKRHESQPSFYHRLIWCPYVPDGNEEDMSSLLCVSHNEVAEIWKVDTVMKEISDPVLYVEDVKIGFRTVNEHSKPITAAAFSPDGIALATASLDGEVKFYQINIHEDGTAPKYLHQWSPHNGKPLSSLFFLDNIKDSSADVQFWKFAVTGADNNRELKLWCCKSWSCLQTICFKPNPTDAILPSLKAELDLTGKYLFLSDINRKVLYVLRIRQEKESSQAFICSLSEFAIKYPVLSLAVVNVGLQKAKSATVAKVSSANEDDGEDEEEDEREDVDDDDDDDSDISDIGGQKRLNYHMKLYWIHTKSLQSCRIIYSLKTESPLHSVDSVGSSQDSFVYRDGLTDLMTDDQTNMNIIEQETASTKCLSPVRITAVLTSPSPTTVTSLPSHHDASYRSCDDILLTPKDFTSPSHSNLPSVNINTTFKLPSVDEVCSDLGAGNLTSEQENISAVSPDINSCSRRKSSQHSCTSSPSREVAEILSPRQLLNHDSENLTPNDEEKECELPQNDELPNSSICDSPVTQSYQLNDWPQAPDPNKEYKVTARGDRDQHEQNRHAISPLGSLNDDDDMSSRMIRNDSAYLQMPYLQRMEQAVESLSLKLTSTSDIIHQQNQTIQYIQNELQELRQQQQKYTQNNLQHFGALDSSISTKMEQILSKNSVSEYARIENLFSKRDGSDKQRIEQQSAVLSQSLISGVSMQLEKVVKQEVSTIVPHITAYVDKLFLRLQDTMLQKFYAADNSLKESVTKQLQSKTFMDNLAQSLYTPLQETIQTICRETFQNSVIPAFDKSCQILMQQMNDVFASGTTDYVQQLDRQRQAMSGNFEVSITKLQDQLKKLSTEVDSVAEKQQNKMQQNATETAKQNEILLAKVRQTVVEEMRRGLKEQTSTLVALRSQTATPISQNEPVISLSYLLQLVKQGKINEAFQEVLSVSDIKPVLLLCESVSLDQVFGPTPCPLAQHVLLSLIQQLSVDLQEKTEIKVRFIEDAIASLDCENAVTKEHSGLVLKQLDKKMTIFMQQNPNHVLYRNCKRIRMAVNSLRY